MRESRSFFELGIVFAVPTDDMVLLGWCQGLETAEIMEPLLYGHKA
jgi:hypothetical protein